MITSMKHIRVLLSCLLVLALASCERALGEKDTPANPVSVFDYLWNKLDQQYAFFDVKGIDWDSVYEVYRPKVYDAMTDDSLFSVCAAMLNTLEDGHVNLWSGFDVSRSDSLYYKMIEGSNFDESVVLLHYLTAYGHTTGGFRHNAIRNGKVAYIRYGSFSSTITNADLRYIVNLYKDCKGLILDLRDNGGGSLSNVIRLLGIFDNHHQELFKSQIKSGPGHDEFTELRTVYAADSSLLGQQPYMKPVAVLIDRGSFSATSFFAVATQGYGNLKLFGDLTGGGMGLPNGGILPNGWNYRFSITRTIANDGGNYENGVPPAERVFLDPTLTAQGIDNIIETAADWIVQ